jgi:hypothetical protein
MTDVRQTELVAVGSLLLDPENPRLPDELDAGDQQELLRYFLSNYQPDEIAESMAENGYFSEEPLLVVPSGDAFVVVEGNRRLAALKLLTSAADREALRTPTRWRDLAEAAQDKGLDQVPVVRYAARDELLDYLGFRHVSGIVPWTPEAKARFVSSLVLRHGYTFRDAARAIGSRSDAIRRQVLAYATLQQTKQAGFDVRPAERLFGFFYRSLQSPGVRRHMHVPDPGDLTEGMTSPVAPGSEPAVAEVISWLFGNEAEHQKPVIRESRQVDALGHVLLSTEATDILRETRDLDLALDVAGGDPERMKGSLLRARRALIVANGQAYQFAGDDEVIESAQRVQEVLTQVLKTLGAPSTDDKDSDHAPASS